MKAKEFNRLFDDGEETTASIQNEEYEARHYFFLNPYKNCAFTRCPKCDAKTKVRKFPLVIHIEPHQMLLLNKQCKYCLNCDLIIAKESDLEHLLTTGFSRINPEIIGNNYLVMGTVEKKDWREGNKQQMKPSEIIERMYVFKDILKFELIPAGRYPASNQKLQQQFLAN
ncbi:MAG: hypothetical protein SV062_15065 [Thermodesulfobacteriota bacterium]|nr:hypothetical protein [Thermodesulfobacteriota bacterium]